MYAAQVCSLEVQMCLSLCYSEAERLQISKPACVWTYSVALVAARPKTNSEECCGYQTQLSSTCISQTCLLVQLVPSFVHLLKNLAQAASAGMTYGGQLNLVNTQTHCSAHCDR